MALQKSKELPSGVVGEYWKIIEVKVDRLKNELCVRIALFKDKAASDAGKQSLGIVHLFSGIQNEEALTGELAALGYDMIKLQLSQPPPNAVSGKLIAYNDLVGAQDD